MHQIQTEIDKNFKKFSFLKFFCSFFVLFEKHGRLEIKRRLIKSFCYEVDKVSTEKKTHNLRQKMTKTSKCTNFLPFYATFVKFLEISWIKTFNTINSESFCCPIGLFAERNAVL